MHFEPRNGFTWQGTMSCARPRLRPCLAFWLVGFSPDDGGSMFLRNVCIYPHRRRILYFHISYVVTATDRLHKLY
jgi:hypothetical protein